MAPTSTFDPVRYRDAARAEWGAAAAGWRAWAGVLEADDAGLAVSRTLVELAGIGPGSYVLDVAAGYGEPGLTAAGRRPGGEVVCTDLSGPMLAVGRERAAAAGLANLEFVEAGAGAGLRAAPGRRAEPPGPPVRPRRRRDAGPAAVVPGPGRALGRRCLGPAGPGPVRRPGAGHPGRAGPGPATRRDARPVRPGRPRPAGRAGRGGRLRRGGHGRHHRHLPVRLRRAGDPLAARRRPAHHRPGRRPASRGPGAPLGPRHRRLGALHPPPTARSTSPTRCSG